MSWRWFKQWNVTTDASWLEASLTERGALATFEQLTMSSTPRFTIRSRAGVEALMRSHGADAPGDLVGRLLELRLLEELPDGSIEVTGWRERQPKYPSDAPDAARERKQRQRERGSVVSPERSRAVTSAGGNEGPVTYQEGDTEGEGEQEKESDPPRGVRPSEADGVSVEYLEELARSQDARVSRAALRALTQRGVRS